MFARPPSLVAPLLVVALLSACASTREVTVRKTIAVDSSPAGAQISMTNRLREVSIGTAPTKVDVDVTTEYVDFDPWSLVLSGTWCGATAGLLWLGSRDESGSAGKPLALIGGIGSAIVCFFTGMDTLITAIHDGNERDTYYKLGAPTFSAELRGYKNATIELDRHELPSEVPLVFHLRQQDAVAADEHPVTPNGEVEVLAVFDLTSTATLTAASPILAQLTEYLASRLAETGRYRIVPREQIHRALIEQKKASYADCIDESCQIELGKAVAAQLSLRTQLIHIGSECALSATMYDLKLEATSTGASVRTPCGAEKLMDGVDTLVHKLTK